MNINKEKTLLNKPLSHGGGFKHVNYLWDDAKAATLEGDEVSLLIYRSNLLGADLRLTNYGGGNTSCKAMAKDPLTGQEVSRIRRGRRRTLRAANTNPISPPAIDSAARASVGMLRRELRYASAPEPAASIWESPASGTWAVGSKPCQPTPGK